MGFKFKLFNKFHPWRQSSPAVLLYFCFSSKVTTTELELSPQTPSQSCKGQLILRTINANAGKVGYTCKYKVGYGNHTPWLCPPQTRSRILYCCPRNNNVWKEQSSMVLGQPRLGLREFKCYTLKMQWEMLVLILPLSFNCHIWKGFEVLPF